MVEMRRTIMAALVVGLFVLAAAPVADASSTYASTVLSTPGLVSFWRMDEQGAQTDAEGMTVADATGANPGTYHLGVNLGVQGALEGDPATAAHFGTPDGYADVPYASNLNTSSFTVEGWVNPDQAAAYMTAIGNGAQLSDDDGWDIQTFSDYSKFGLDLWIGNGTSTTMLKGLDFTPGTWIYFAATCDGTTARWYENGQLIRSAATAYAPNTSGPTVIGLNPVNSVTGQLFGSLDDLAEYDTALSANTIAEHYELGINDGTPPQTLLTAAPSGVTNQTSATVGFTSASVDPTYQCQLDGGGWQACSSPYQVSGLGNGQHSLSVRATNRAGQVDPDPPTAIWTVDTTLPVTAIASGPPANTNSTSATFSFGAAAGSTFTCQLDDGPGVPCASPYTISGLADGPHTLYVVGTDALGNEQAAASTYSWTVDTAAPTSFIFQGPTAEQPGIAFVFGANQASVSFRCEVDARPWVQCSSPFSQVPTNPGTHTFRVQATDSVGNVEPTGEVYSWTVPPYGIKLRATLSHTAAVTIKRGRQPCTGRKHCVTPATATRPTLHWKVSTKGTLTLTVITSHAAVAARATVTTRSLTGDIVLPAALMRKIGRPGRYTVLVQARSRSASSAIVQITLRVE